MNTFEYKIISCNSEELERLLNTYGKQGWECFHIENRDQKPEGTYIAFLKRTKQSVKSFK